MDPWFSVEELKARGFKYVGKDAKVFRQSVIVNEKYVSLGDGCQIDDFVHIIAGDEVLIGRRVHVSTFSSIAGGGKVELGDYAGLSAGCRLISGSDAFLGEAMTNPCVPIEYRKVARSFIKVGKHAILGTNTIVLPGITIGAGAATAAGSIVNKDLPDWGVYVGAGTKRLCERPKDTIEFLEKKLVAEHGY